MKMNNSRCLLESKDDTRKRKTIFSRVESIIPSQRTISTHLPVSFKLFLSKKNFLKTNLKQKTVETDLKESNSKLPPFPISTSKRWKSILVLVKLKDYLILKINKFLLTAFNVYNLRNDLLLYFVINAKFYNIFLCSAHSEFHSNQIADHYFITFDFAFENRF